METSTLYFSDNFFSAGLTSIYDENQNEIGKLDLKSSFSSSLRVMDLSGNLFTEGRFRFFSGKWTISDATNTEIGLLRQRFTFFTKKYEYEAYGRGIYTIISESFSKEYSVLDVNEQEVAHFVKTSGIFQSDAYKRTNRSNNLSNEELIAMVMGITMIIKSNAAAAT
ncbi:hypothetical protein ACSVDE_16805 [Pseudalkalibacillus sp. Hm43]|uniref:hypothetical protein n=1 Tax=Pseudalkalibacillus sp. Hm43 TaxID=3450742 RepID=UPI003F43AB90